MAWTETELKRIEAIELKLNDIQIALNNLATVRQLKEYINLRQSEINNLKNEVAALEQRIIDLENA